MHEKILQGVTVGIVAGLAVYWLTSSNRFVCGRSSQQGQFAPLLGDVRAVNGGTPSYTLDHINGNLPVADNNEIPLATDYLNCAPQYSAPTSKWNVGVSIQTTCGAVCNCSLIYRKETASSFPHGIRGRGKITSPPVQLQGTPPTCQPNVSLQVECAEVV
jgi:hypothetical protein